LPEGGFEEVEGFVNGVYMSLGEVNAPFRTCRSS
jgi:hypothetical protein